MPLPKRRTPRSKKHSRRTHWKLSLPSLTECPRCHELKASHQACPSCGFYKDRQVIQVAEKKKK